MLPLLASQLGADIPVRIIPVAGACNKMMFTVRYDGGLAHTSQQAAKQDATGSFATPPADSMVAGVGS